MMKEFALCADEKFVVPALVCITSIFEHHKEGRCRVTVLTDGLSRRAAAKFDQLSSTYGQTIDVRTINPSQFESLVSYGRYPISMYYRFLLPELLTTVQKVLYLDCDTMVRRSLDELFSIDLSDKACAVVVDQQCDDIQTQNRLRTKSPYFNSGVMLMNLVEWRKSGLAQRLVSFIRGHVDVCKYPDQDALNSILDGRVVYMGYGYNMQEMWLTMLDYARFSHMRYEDLAESKKDPFIIHFCVGDKPWYKECKNPYMEEYLHYATLHGFIGFKRRSHYRWPYFRLEAEIQRMKRWQKKLMR